MAVETIKKTNVSIKYLKHQEFKLNVFYVNVTCQLQGFKYCIPEIIMDGWYYFVRNSVFRKMKENVMANPFATLSIGCWCTGKPVRLESFNLMTPFLLSTRLENRTYKLSIDHSRDLH